MLVIRPSLQEADIHTLKKQAQSDSFARGEVISSANGLIFESGDGGANELLEQDLKRFFCKKVSALHNARVTTRKQTPAANTHDDFSFAE